MIWIGVNFSSFQVQAQTQPQTLQNPIELKISAVTRNGVREATRQESPTSWSFDPELSLDDQIRFNWKGVDLNLKYKTNPVTEGGWLNVYIQNEGQNYLIAETASDVYPLRIGTIAQHLREGKNTLLFSYVNSFSKIEYKPVSFTFNLKKLSLSPALRIIKPQPKAVFMNGVEQEIVVEIRNFKLTNTLTREPNTGKLLVYLNSTNNRPLGRFVSSRELSGGLYELTLKSTELDFSNIADNPSANLIFALADQNDKLTGITTDLPVILNYNNTLNVGLPKVSIIEPRKDRSNPAIKGDDRFIVQIENFELLKERPTTSTSNPSSNSGFLQIIVISGDYSQPLQPIWPSTEFTLNEIDYKSNQEGVRTIKVQLVNQNFELLKPEARDTIEIVYQPETNDNSENPTQVQNNTWRFVLIGLTIFLIVGGISILITKG